MRKYSLLGVAMLLSAILAACGAQPAPQAQTVEVTRVVEVEKESTVVVEKEVEKEVVVTATPEPIAEHAEVVVIGMSQEPDSLLPHISSMAVQREVLHAYFEPLITTLDYDFQPNLIEELPTLENGGATLDDGGTADDKTDDVLQVTFKLKEGLAWCDGEPVTAEDSVFSFNIQNDPESGVTSRSVLDKIESYEALDDQTIQVTFKKGESYSLYFTTIYTPYPEHLWGDYSAAELVEAEEAARTPCGYGPYTVTEWVAGDRIELEANPHYYRSEEGLPNIKRLVYRIVPDTNQLLAQLASGDVDVVTSDALQATQAALYTQFQDQGLLKIYPIPSATWEHVDMNLFAPTTSDSTERTTPHPILSDIRVRQAIAHGIDRQSIVDNLYAGQSAVMNTFIPPDHWAYAGDENVTVYEYDAEKAKALLAEAGWTDSDGDGILDKDGQKLTLRLGSTAGNVLRERWTQLVKANLGEIGMDIQIQLVPASVWFGDTSGLVVGDFELGGFAWVGQADPGGETLYSCKDIPSPANNWTGQNYMGWCNETADAAIKLANSSLEREERIEAYTTVQQEYTKDMVSLPLFQRLNIFGSGPTIQGLQPNATEYTTWNVAEWDKPGE